MREIVRRFGPLLRPFAGRILVAIAAMTGDAALTVLRPWPLKVVIDGVLSNRRIRMPVVGPWLNSAHLTRMDLLYGACAATLVIALGTGLLTFLYTRVLGTVGQRFVSSMRCDLFAHMQRLSLRFHDGQRTGDLITRLTSDIGSIRDLVTSGLTIFGSNAFLLLGTLLIMLWLNWRFALASLSVAPFLFWAAFWYRNRIKAAAREVRASTGLLASLAQETLSSIRIVQGLAQEGQQDQRFQAQSETGLQASLESVRYQARKAPLVDLLRALGLVITMWYGAARVLAGELTTGDVVLFFSYVNKLYSPMNALSGLGSVFNRAVVGAERIAEVLLAQSEVAAPAHPRPVDSLTGRIEFAGVSFAYEPGRPVLSEISLSIRAGEVVAIVGMTGAGKSTLACLIPRLYDPATGSVRIDGVDIRDFSPQQLREQIGLVLQDSLIFSGSIRENIAFGRPGAGEKDIRRAAWVANADEFISRLPAGYDTMVSERGTTLSGGQKQRIAIARAVVRNAPILILDEPTSSLDANSERQVMRALEQAVKGRTTLIIAHRLSTVRLAQRIVVLHAGRIVEEGTHTELISQGGRYAELYASQNPSHMTAIAE